MQRTICPNCASANVRLKPIATRTCGGIGAITGLLTAAKAGSEGADIGRNLLPRFGAAIGGAAGFLTGLLTGALSGAAVGHAIDRKIIQAYHCNDCGHDFAA